MESHWLKTDPENGMLIGPGGGHHPNEHQAAHYDLLGLCGCGNPTGAFNFCRAVLSCFDRRKALETRNPSDWINAEKAIQNLVMADPEMTAHVLAHLLDRNDLLEHGSSIGGSWLAKNGEIVVDLPPATDEIMDED